MKKIGFVVLSLILIGTFTWGGVPGESRVLVVCPEDWAWYWDCPYTSIQAAIDVAQAGDTILIHGALEGPATYEENLKIDVPNLTLKGEDRRLVFIQGIEEGEPALHVQSPSSKVTITGVTISDSPIGILVDGEADVSIDWSAFEGNGIGVELHDQATAFIAETEFIRQKDTGIAVYDEAQLTIKRCEFYRTLSEELGDGGMEVWVGGEAQATIQESRFQPEDTSISIADLAKATIKDNEFLGGGRGGGIALGVDRMPHTMLSDLPQAPYAVIKGNRIHDLKGWGVTMFRGSQAIIHGNEIFDNRLEGIEISNGSWAAIYDNRIYKNGSKSRDEEPGDGILIYQGGSTLILDNYIEGNGGAGIAIADDSQAYIAKNLIRGNTGEGVLLYSWLGPSIPEEERRAREPQVKLWNNEISGNGGWGVAATVRECYPEYEQLPESFLGVIEGGWNEIHGNAKGDLCPADYPWPEGFVRED